MNRLFLSCLLSVSLALPVLASEPPAKPATPAAPTAPTPTPAPAAPTPTPTPAPGMDAHKAGTHAPEQKDHPGHKDMAVPAHHGHKGHHHKTKEEQEAEMAKAATKCKEDIAKAEEAAKAAPAGEDKDMADYHIDLAKIEQKALENKNMISHWYRHKNRCHRNVKKSENFAKKHHHAAAKPAEHASSSAHGGAKPADHHSATTPATGTAKPAEHPTPATGTTKPAEHPTTPAGAKPEAPKPEVKK